MPYDQEVMKYITIRFIQRDIQEDKEIIQVFEADSSNECSGFEFLGSS